MSNIHNMNDKQLRNEVQLLRDELAIMKRQYEDIIYNLDTDNFSQRIVKQGKDMYTKIEQTADEISLQAEKITDNETKVAELSVTAGKISSEVSAVKKDVSKNKSLIEQTAESISGIVSEFVDVSQAIEVDSTDEFKNTDKIYVIRENNTETFYHYNTILGEWKSISGDGIIYSLFEQTDDGFRLKGDVKVEGSCILTDSLTFNASDKPVQVEYSVDGETNWHTVFASDSDKFMRIKIGSQWSNAMKIVGEDGENGLNGTNATVSTKDIFNFLTNNGADQGIFPFYRESPYNGSSSQTQVFINAEYIQAGTLSGITVQSTDASGNVVETSDGHIQLYPSGYSYSLVDLGMYQVGTNWEPRMRFGRGVDSGGTNGTGWIYKTTNGFGMMYNTAESDALTIEFNDYSNAIEIIGNVNFSGGTVNGLPAGGTGGVATFG